jgi:alpha-ribazole phosphatase
LARLLLVRHGNTKLDNAHRFWGKTDVELSDDGIRQAERLKDRLANQKIDTVFTSSLSRAWVTAEIIVSGRKALITACPELDEINFGYVEGLTFDEISKKHPELSATLNDWRIRPSFPGGESLDELNLRVQKFMKQLENHQPEETILIVAHAGTLRVLICGLLEMKVEHWRQMQLDLASLSIIDTYPKGAIINRLNDISHLQMEEKR